MGNFKMTFGEEEMAFSANYAEQVLKGEQGLQGETGEKGETGLQGPQGEQGYSAYQIAVKNGFIGTELEWLESLKGKDGAATVDNTLTVEGAAADAKVTGEEIKKIKDGAITTEYYAVNIAELVANGLGNTVAQTESVGSSVALTAGVIFILATFENNIQHKIINAPFEFIYVNGAVWNNKHQFTRVGITSPVITQQFGLSDILWFDTTIPKIIEHLGAFENSYELFFNDNSVQEDTQGIIFVGFTIEFGIQQIAYQARDLWQAILANNDTRLVFEYKKQENIPVIDAPFVYGTTPIDLGGLDNEN